MNIYHVQMYLNGMDNFAVGEKVWKTILKWEDLAPDKH